ncbi:MAG: hypothetical protein CMJ27_02875 [Phycisphaerae bacterium]|nr:hypothetical protein [Phycisphaerae bacterium]
MTMTKYGGIFQNKFKRPKIRPARNRVDRLLDGTTLYLVLCSIGYALWQYPGLPATIPTKFNGAGQVVSTGPAATIFLMPAVGLLICTILRAVQHWPWFSNTIVEITEENAEAQYRLINRLLGWCGVLIGGLFLFIEISIVQGAITGKSPSAAGIVAFATLPWLPLLGWYFRASFKAA